MRILAKATNIVNMKFVHIITVTLILVLLAQVTAPFMNDNKLTLVGAQVPPISIMAHGCRRCKFAKLLRVCDATTKSSIYPS
jgi:hypothetical protein